MLDKRPTRGGRYARVPAAVSAVGWSGASAPSPAPHEAPRVPPRGASVLGVVRASRDDTPPPPATVGVRLGLAQQLGVRQRPHPRRQVMARLRRLLAWWQSG